MANKRLPAIVFSVAAITYTIWFFHDFPTRIKETVARRIGSATVAELSFNMPSGSNSVRRLNDMRDLARLAAAFNKAGVISLPESKQVIFGRVKFFIHEKETLRMEFCSFPVVLIDGRSYAVSPAFQMTARLLAEGSNLYE